MTSYVYDPGREPIIIAPGYGENRHLFDATARELASLMSRDVITATFPRWHNPYPELIYARAGNAITRQAEAIIQLMDARKFPTATLLGHSLGALSAIVAAITHPKRISTLVLAAPAGVMPSDTLVDLAIRVLRKSAANLVYAKNSGERGTLLRAWLGNLSGATYQLANPWRALSEARASLTANLDDLMRDLHSRTKVIIIGSQDDLVFPSVRPGKTVAQTYPGAICGPHDVSYLMPRLFAQVVRQRLQSTHAQ